MSPKRKAKHAPPVVKAARPTVQPFPTRTCPDCGGTVLVGMESFHSCPGRYVRTTADGTRGMTRGVG